MDGFSDHDLELDVEVGHASGLRWFSADHDGILSGTRGKWQPGENVAECLSQRDLLAPYDAMHEIPAKGCGCGFWAYWALGEKRVYKGPYVVGIINGYGRTTEGEAGFRCSHAEIEALWLEQENDTLALLLEDIYKVPVHGSLDAMLLMHPAPDGQPPLSDNYYGFSRRDDPGGREAGESVLSYARRNGFPVAPPARVTKALGMVGASAVERLHQRREGWARGASASRVIHDEAADGPVRYARHELDAVPRYFPREWLQ